MTGPNVVYAVPIESKGPYDDFQDSPASAPLDAGPFPPIIPPQSAFVNSRKKKYNPIPMAILEWLPLDCSPAARIALGAPCVVFADINAHMGISSFALTVITVYGLWMLSIATLLVASTNGKSMASDYVEHLYANTRLHTVWGYSFDQDGYFFLWIGLMGLFSCLFLFFFQRYRVRSFLEKEPSIGGVLGYLCLPFCLPCSVYQLARELGLYRPPPPPEE